VRQKIAGLPVGKGLLGVVMKHGQSIRTNDISADPRSRGLPEHHPPLSSLLAVPVICRGPFRGNLYLSERIDGKSFTKIDEETLIRFASQTAIAVDNAHLHARVRSLAVVEERLRLSREMHDGQAQVLAYVNTKAQAVGELLRAGRLEEARDHLSQLAAAAREIYTDVREGIFGLRRIVDHERGLAEAIRDHVEQWQEQSKIPVTLELDDLPRFSTDVELQLLRILQESLANVRKHSGATRARVEVCYEDGGAKIEVEDDGEGFDPANPKRQRRPRFGLATMRERAEAIDASLMLDSRPGSGTRVQLVYRPRLEEAS
ncbi:MAG: GAF domain-containing sensor histidine kinase, partial [Holophagales bacterium]|nr:GAF domain-containing sensor histidine kinase [Holophagales bacterium]